MSFLELESIFFSQRTVSWERKVTRTGQLLEKTEMDLGSSLCEYEEFPGEVLIHCLIFKKYI